MVELGLPELSAMQIETLCETAENAARKYIQSRVASKLIDCLDIVVEAQGTKPIDLSVEVDLILDKAAKDIDTGALVEEAVAQAHLASETFLRKQI